MKNSAKEQSEEVFRLLVEADQKLWQAVLAIQEHDLSDLENYVMPLMQMRGDIHVQFMRPIYKRYPELATAAGFDYDQDA